MRFRAEASPGQLPFRKELLLRSRNTRESLVIERGLARSMLHDLYDRSAKDRHCALLTRFLAARFNPTVYMCYRVQALASKLKEFGNMWTTV